MLIYEFEEIRGSADAFGGTQHQTPLRPQGIVKHLHHATLYGRLEIDEQIAAAHEIKPRERRIARYVVAGENAQIADAFGDVVATVLFDKEARQTLARNLFGDVLEVNPEPCFLNGS